MKLIVTLRNSDSDFSTKQPIHQVVSDKKQKDMEHQAEALKLIESGMSKRAIGKKMVMSNRKLNRILAL